MLSVATGRERVLTIYIAQKCSNCRAELYITRSTKESRLQGTTSGFSGLKSMASFSWTSMTKFTVFVSNQGVVATSLLNSDATRSR